MRKDRITGLIIKEDVLEWTTLHRVMERLEVVDSGRVELGVITEEETEERKKGEISTSASLSGHLGQRPDVANLKSRKGTWSQRDFTSKIKNQKWGKGEITVGLPSDHMLLRVVSLPAVDENELGPMVQLQVDKFSPFPVESMVVSHEVLENLSTRSTGSHRRQGFGGQAGQAELVTDKGNTCLVLIAAVRKEIIDTLGKTLGTAGIYPTRIDASVLGWWRLLSDAGQIETKGRQVALLMDKTGLEIIVFKDGVPIVFRWLEKSEGLTEDEFANEMAGEIGYTLMSLELEHGAGELSSITVWPRTLEETPEALVEKLHAEYSCEVAVKPLESLPSVSEGLARRTAAQDRAKLDLIPAEWRIAGKAKLFKKRMFIVAGVLFGTWAFGAVSFFGGLYCQEHKLASLKKKQVQAHKPAMEVRDMRRRVVMIKRYIDRTYSALECLRQISIIQPGGIDLTSFTYRKGEGIKISGEAGSVNLVYSFKNKLDGAPLFLETTLHGPRHDERKKKEIFDIELKLPGGEQ